MCGDVLRSANDPLTTDIPTNMFVTCFYAILDPNSGSLRYANAGHDLPYLRRRSADDAEELRARRMPLGLMPAMSYEEMEIVLEAGNGVLFYSDGLVEDNDSKGEMFGFPRLQALVANHGEKRSLGNFLLEELYSFTGRAESRRMTSPSLRYDVQLRYAEHLRKPLVGNPVNRGNGAPLPPLDTCVICWH